MNPFKFLVEKIMLFSLATIVSASVVADNSQSLEQSQEINKLKQQIQELQNQVQRLEADQAQTKLFKSPTSNPSKTIDNKSHYGMDKCKVVDVHGNGLIKPYMADSGANLEGDRNAWIWVPYGQCKKINQGDFTGVPHEIRNKIHSSNITNSGSYQ
jgi:uncharacterized protein YlxW (UPF0749 family)